MLSAAILWTLLACATGAFAAAGADGAGVTLFRDVRVFDGERSRGVMDVLVRDGRIERVAESIEVPEGADASSWRVVDGRGEATLMPGLIDAHTHVLAPEDLERALVFGVTTELDMFSPIASTRSLRENEANDRADVRTSGTLATAPGGHGTQFGLPVPTLTGPEEADAWVAARVAEGSDYIKIVYDDGAGWGGSIPTISRETLRALVAAAHERDRMAVVHVHDQAKAIEAIQAGADGLVHLFFDTPPREDFVELAKEHGVFVVPTATILANVAGMNRGAGLASDERLAPLLLPREVAGLSREFPGGGTPRSNFEFVTEAIERLHEAGVPILAGTDAPNPGTAHGVSMHDELALLVEAGLSPEAALASATSVPAEAFGLRDRGRIEAGTRADLVLVEGDPTTDVTATRNLRGVWKRGVAVDLEAARDAAAMARAAPADGPARPTGVVSDFESGRADAAYGAGWSVSTDSMMQGKSTASMEVVEGGANGSGHALKVTGRIDPALPYAWAGAMLSPGDRPYAPADVSAGDSIAFRTKGDGGTYRLMILSESAGMTPPPAVTFVAPEGWTRYEFGFDAFGGFTGADLAGVLFTGGPEAGEFEFLIDDVSIQTRGAAEDAAPSKEDDVTHAQADWVEAGEKAPEFTLPADDGSKVSLKDFRGRPVVLYFYPKDDTPGCTKEACAFRDRRDEMQELGAVVLGVSPDSVESHREFKAKYDLNFPLLADEEHEVSEAYGAWRERNLYGKTTMGIQRSTFLIGPDGTVKKVWKRVNVDEHDVQVLEALRGL